MSWLVVWDFKTELPFFFFGAELREEQEAEGKTGADSIVRFVSWKEEMGQRRNTGESNLALARQKRGPQRVVLKDP